jgi:outer membrane lipoprotein-sorting protein
VRLFATLVLATTIAASAASAQMDLRPKPGASPTAPVAGAEAACADKPTVERVNAYFNAISGLTSDFTQTGPDGRKYTGKLYIQRPGKMKFEYAPPSPLEIISDGRTVAVRDKKAGTQDDYLVGQTPLKFLLRDKIDVSRDSKVVSLSQSGSEAVLVLEDRQTVGGTSRIRLTFDNCSMGLKGWVVTDPQGYNTRVAISGLNTGARPSASLFVIPAKVSTPN